MVIDTSAVVAILFGAPEAEWISRMIEAATPRLISGVSRVEMSFVVERRKGEAGRADLDALLAAIRPEIVSVTPAQTELALDGFRRFGKGRHRARLNIGDCFAYALSRSTGQPLLFKGDDFIHTDAPLISPSRP